MNNVLFVTADSLRYDALSYTGRAKETSPFLDSLAEEGIFFDNAIATGPGTSTSFPGILASALPMEYGYRGLNTNHVSLAEQFQQADITTIGVSASTHVSSLYNYDRGFDKFYQNPNITGGNESPSLKRQTFDTVKKIPVVRTIGRQFLRSAQSVKRDISGVEKPYELADAITDTAIDSIETAVAAEPDARRFVWIHYMEPHSPPYPPESYIEQFHGGDYTTEDVYELWQRWRRNRPPLWDEGTSLDATTILTEEEVQTMREYYHAQVRFLDDQIQRLHDALDNLGIRDETTFLFTADHGEEFFEHGDLAHRQKLYDELIHVPLLAYHGGGEFAECEDCTAPVSLADLGPTIADLFEIGLPEQWQGSSFASVFDGSTHDREYTISELCHSGLDEGYGGDIQPEKAVMSVRTAEWKYIRNRQKDSDELYNLVDDPEETTNLYGDSHEIVTRLERVAADRLDSLTDQQVNDVEVSSDVQQRLSELGYTGE